MFGTMNELKISEYEYNCAMAENCKRLIAEVYINAYDELVGALVQKDFGKPKSEATHTAKLIYQWMRDTIPHWLPQYSADMFLKQACKKANLLSWEGVKQWIGGSI